MIKIVKKALRKLNIQVSRVQRENPAFLAQQKLVGSSSSSKVTIFDVGAYIGDIALDYYRLFPKADILCFEPFPESFDLLKGNVSAVKNIQLFPFGFGAKTGPQEISSNAFSATNSLLKTDNAGKKTWGEGLLETKERLSVAIKTLDEVVTEQGIDHIDILKLDVQGAEHLVLNGAIKTLKAGKIGLVYTEIILLPTYEGQRHFDETLLRFRELGYRLYDLYNSSYNKNRQLRQVDAIFVLDK